MSIQLTDETPIDRADEILTPEALAFVERLHDRFATRRNELLGMREARRAAAPLEDVQHAIEEIGTLDRATAGWR